MEMLNKRQLKKYKKELIKKVNQEYDRLTALETQLDQVQSTFAIYRLNRIQLSSFLKQEIEKEKGKQSQ